MKMPWYSMYHGEGGGGSRHRNSYQPSRHSSTLTGSSGSASHSHTIYHPIRLTSTSSATSSSPYSTPTYRQHSYYTAHTHTHVPSSGRRSQSNSSYSSGNSTHTTTTTSGGGGGGGNSHYGLDGNRHQRHSSPSSGFGAFKSRAEWHHKRMDSATERLLARADALTDRLHRLLAKSADLHWRRTDHYVPRADIFSRMSHATSASTTTTAPPAPSAAPPSPSPPVATTTIPSKPMPSREPIRRDDDIRVTVNVDVERRASSPTPPPSPPPPPPKVHVITIKLSNSCSNNHRPKTKPSVVRIIPIHIEKDSSQDIDELDIIQHPDYDSPPTPPPPPPASVHHIPIYHECSTVALDRPSSPVDASAEVELHPDFESETIDCQPEPPLSVSVGEHPSTHQSRRLALTLSLAEEKKTEGNIYYKSKDYRKALMCYSRAIELCPDCVSYYGNRSACRMMMGQYQEALHDARDSVRLDSSYAKGYVRIAKCCLALGDTAAALNAINKAEELDPTSDLANEKRSLQALNQLTVDMAKAFDKSDFRRVIYCCDRALEHATAARHLKLKKAECLALLGRYAEAEEMANDVLRSDNNNADALLVRGLCFYYQDNIDQAFRHFKQVLIMAPDHKKASEIFKKAKKLIAKKEEGNEAFKACRYQEAYDLYSSTLLIDPTNRLTNAKLYFNRAVVLCKMSKYKEAIADCNNAIELDETYLKAYLRRAKTNMDLENFEEAVRDYEKIVKMDKSSREYKKNLQDAKIALKKSLRKDYYKILGIDRNANDDEIKKAYKKRALVHHPDRHSSATEEEKKEQERKFKELGEAYGILSDPKKKSRYDNGHDLEDLDHGYGAADVDPNQIFQAFFGGPGMFRMGNMGGMHHGGGMGGGGHCPGSFNFQFG